MKCSMKCNTSIALMALAIAGCSKEPQKIEAVDTPPSAPSITYESLLVSDTGVGDTFAISPREMGGSAVNYQSRAGLVNVMEQVVEYPDATGYITVEKAYKFGEKYILVVSTGEGGRSCPATTYAFTYDTKGEYVSGKAEIDGCSEIVESMTEGNKLTVKKDGKASVFYNGDVKSTQTLADATQGNSTRNQLLAAQQQAEEAQREAQKKSEATAREQERATADFPECASDEAQIEIANTMENAPLRRVYGLSILKIKDPRQVSASSSYRACSGIALLNNAESYPLTYRFYRDGEDVMVEAQLQGLGN